MLKTDKTTSLTGLSTIDGVSAMSFNANIDQNGSGSTFSANVQDQDLYAKNRVECRKDKDDFEKEMYKIQDALIDEQKETAE